MPQEEAPANVTSPSAPISELLAGMGTHFDEIPKESYVMDLDNISVEDRRQSGTTVAVSWRDGS